LTENKIVCQVDHVDSTIYSFKKFFALAADCNPSIIDLLFTKDSEIIWSDYYGDELREAAPLFLSQRVRYSFTGYATSQLKRIYTHRRWILNPVKNKPERADYGLPCSSLIPPDQRQAAQALIDKQVRLWLLEEAEVDKVILDQIQSDLLLLIGNILDLQI
jgi:predicted nucleotidyltransferase